MPLVPTRQTVTDRSVRKGRPRGDTAPSPRDDSQWSTGPRDRMLSGMESHDQDPTTPQSGGDAGDASDPSERPTEPSSAAGPPAADPPPPTPSPTPTPAGGAAEEPRRLYRSRDERLIGG